MGGFLGIPNLGILKPKEPMTASSEKTVDSTLSSSVSASPSPTDQSMLDENRKECIAAADEKIKQATEEKKNCDTKFPRKKFLGLFGGKKRSRKNKNMKKTKKTKRTSKHRKTASK